MYNEVPHWRIRQDVLFRRTYSTVSLLPRPKEAVHQWHLESTHHSYYEVRPCMSEDSQFGPDMPEPTLLWDQGSRSRTTMKTINSCLIQVAQKHQKKLAESRITWYST